MADPATTESEPGTPSSPGDLTGIEHVDFIGIGGCGMSGLARMLNAMGITCSGSDINPSSTISSLVQEGLSIRTVRPVFSNVTLATARPSNPVVRIDFRRNGKPIRVVFIKSSGHAQVDIEVRKALFKWRASGNALSQLPDPEDPNTPAYVSVKLEILL